MTPAQRELARHALGLDGRRSTSYRNRFVAGDDHEDCADWQAMVEQGDAVRIDGRRLSYAGDHLFMLTKQGAEKACEAWEKLDPEDFP